MSIRPMLGSAIAATALSLCVPVAALATKPPLPLGRLTGGARAALTPNADGTYGLAISGAGAASVTQPHPAALELDTGPRPVGDGAGTRLRSLAAGYTHVVKGAGGLTATASLQATPGVRVVVVDALSVRDGELRVTRRLTVHGSARGGFDSAFTLAAPKTLERKDVGLFAPGVLYGSTQHLPPDGRTGRLAIGSAPVYGAGYHGIARIREDRLSAPLFGARFRDGSSVTVLDAAPDGATTAADATTAGTLVDAGLRFGALGSELTDRHLRLGYWFPGTEGEVTYGLGTSETAADRHRWLRREHPLRDGLTQHYALRVQVGRSPDFAAYRTTVWRWAWRVLRPGTEPVDLGVVRRSVAAMLADRIVTTPFGTAIPNDWDAVTGKEIFSGFRPVALGFIGKDVEDAALLLTDARQHPGPDSDRERSLANAMIDTFAARPLNPAAAAGFDLETGNPTSFYPDPGTTYMRQPSDDVKALTHLLRIRPDLRTAHPGWLAWARGFADWLLPLQRADGSFPRAWKNGTGAITDPASSASDEPVSLLLDLTALTGDPRYRAAAIRAGRFAWTQHRDGQYWGATIDQGDVTAKESASLALNADMALSAATGDDVWLAHARADAAALETWTYIWNVPMPTGAGAASLAWKPGVPTVGLNLVAAGTSGADTYSSQDVPELVELYRHTRDPHTLAVARLLLHDSNAMLALPGRSYDLAGVGWQQEFWTLTAPRGTGAIAGGYRDWVPWIAAVKLRSILTTEQQDPGLYARVAAR